MAYPVTERTTRLDRWLDAFAIAYFAAVVVGVLVDYGTDALASSPAFVAHGELWRLLTSALIVEGDLPLLQVAIAGLAAFTVIRTFGAVVWWGAVICAHLGSALVIYGVIGALDALGAESAERVADDLDYGVSVVLTGSLGALFAGALGRGRRDVAVLALAGLLVFLPLSLDWYGVEHPLGFAFGAAFMAWWQRRDAE
jgi:hypothetical protein